MKHRIPFGKVLNVLFFTFAFALPAGAVDAPITYTRSSLMMELNSPQTKSGSNKIAYDVEIRDAESVRRTPDWYNFATRAEFSAGMLVYQRPEYVVLNPTNDFAATDLLMLNAYGDVVQIIPNIVPAQLEEPIPSVQPVLAMLYLKQGSVEKLGIRPGDHVSHRLFRTKPTVMTAPVAGIPTPAPSVNITRQSGTPDQAEQVLLGKQAPASGNTLEVPEDKPVSEEEERETLLDKIFKMNHVTN